MFECFSRFAATPLSVPGSTVWLSLFTLAGLLAYSDTAGAGPNSAGPAPGGKPEAGDGFRAQEVMRSSGG